MKLPFPLALKIHMTLVRPVTAAFLADLFQDAISSPFKETAAPNATLFTRTGLATGVPKRQGMQLIWNLINAFQIFLN
ncbi:hypothetical protein GE253_17955 [Niveispirillum sp. SYP-B3756]|uniref:hypothetical protein n=1 Tax=Niveispirillum sp. SYP-B3756 TaxID=2662178 RepID=UPI001292B48D|nr:hypothetical protein [Niveispirillum sp. SYP-B3756]MQP67212.1 hypothetical protein [Niveispirillum sp. SYP-B3756]